MFVLKVAGGGSMQLRSADPHWLLHVDRWWNVLLPKLAPYTRSRGGPILMVQVNPSLSDLWALGGFYVSYH